jgi:hypothetical protein
MAKKRPQKTSSRRRGQRFESIVRAILEGLAARFPKTVRIRSQELHDSAPRRHRPDFELEYELGGLCHQHLIECQDRDTYSYDIADKIYSVRGGTSRNRYIFIYNKPDFAGSFQEKRLRDMGVLVFNLQGFEKFLGQLEADIALRELGLRVLDNTPANVHPKISSPPARSARTLRGKRASAARISELMESASKYNPNRNSPVDHSMLPSLPSNSFGGSARVRSGTSGCVLVLAIVGGILLATVVTVVTIPVRGLAEMLNPRWHQVAGFAAPR